MQVLFPGDIAGDQVVPDHRPLVLGDLPAAGLVPGMLAFRVHRTPPVGIRAGIEGVMEHRVDRGRTGASPLHLAAVGPRMGTNPHTNVVPQQIPKDLHAAPQFPELVEDQPHHGPHLLIGIEGQRSGRQLHIADRYLEEQLATPGLGQPSLFKAIAHGV